MEVAIVGSNAILSYNTHHNGLVYHMYISRYIYIHRKYIYVCTQKHCSIPYLSFGRVAVVVVAVFVNALLLLLQMLFLWGAFCANVFLFYIFFHIYFSVIVCSRVVFEEKKEKIKKNVYKIQNSNETLLKIVINSVFNRFGSAVVFRSNERFSLHINCSSY